MCVRLEASCWSASLGVVDASDCFDCFDTKLRTILGVSVFGAGFQFDAVGGAPRLERLTLEGQVDEDGAKRDSRSCLITLQVLEELGAGSCSPGDGVDDVRSFVDEDPGVSEAAVNCA
jgi:hypothetical protein